MSYIHIGMNFKFKSLLKQPFQDNIQKVALQADAYKVVSLNLYTL